jgi:phage/plasmid-like protein (TIGR03299 family)
VVGSGQAVYETAGAIREGRRVWILAKLPDCLTIGTDDKIEKFLLFLNGHDGSMSCRMFFTPVRVVCANTYALAINRSSVDEGITIRHVGDIKAKVEEARRVLKVATDVYRDLGEELNILLDIPLTEAGAEAYFRSVVQKVKDQEVEKVEAKEEGKRVLEGIQGVYHTSRTVVRGTAYGAFNAVTEYVDHEVRTSQKPENRFERIVYGSGARLKAKALEVAKALNS